MKLKKELRQRRKAALKKEKEIEMQKVRSESEQSLIDEFIKGRLTRQADIGCNREVFCTQGEYIRDKKERFIYLNVNDFENYAKKHHLKIWYTEKDRETPAPKKFAERVIFRF